LSGISLGPQKTALVSARVGKRMRALGYEDYSAYLDYVRHEDSGDEIIQLIDAVSTNVTSFYREATHFQVLADHLTQCRNKGLKRFRIWCSACSTGEEAYCIAMTALDTLGDSTNVDIRILATDISTKVLQISKKGEYDAQKLSPVRNELLNRYFEKNKDNHKITYKVKPILRNVITFTRLNLSKPPFPMKGPMDVVFCRNVMIYFDVNVRTRLVEDIYRLLKPGGLLMLGHSESLTGLNIPFKTLQPAVYQK